MYSVTVYCKECLFEEPYGCFDGLIETVADGIATFRVAIEIGRAAVKTANCQHPRQIEFQVREQWDHGVVLFSSECDECYVCGDTIDCDELLRHKVDRLGHWTTGDIMCEAKNED